VSEGKYGVKGKYRRLEAAAGEPGEAECMLVAPQRQREEGNIGTNGLWPPAKVEGSSGNEPTGGAPGPRAQQAGAASGRCNNQHM